MKFYLGYESAVHYWLSDVLRDWCQAEYTQSRYTPDAPSGAPWDAVVRKLAGAGFATPLHVLVDNPNDLRPNAHDAECHRFTAVKTPKAFARIAPGVFVATPALAFAQLCSKLTLPEAITLGYELCGTYTRDPNFDDSFIGSRPAITASELQAALARYSDVRGVKLARIAASCVLDNSESPMETLQAAMLHTRRRLGGYGFVNAVLNPEIKLSMKAQKFYGHQVCRCDFYLPEHKIALEYESDLYHDGRHIETSDLPRRNALGTMGITVIPSTKEQVMRLDTLNELARLIAKTAGLQIRRDQYTSNRNRADLHHGLIRCMFDRAFIPRFDTE